MKILIIIDSLGAGGAEKSTEVLSDYLYQIGVPFEILCLYKQSEGVQNRMILNGYKINFVPKRNFMVQSVFIANWIKNGKFSLVHSILFKANLRTRFAKMKVNFIHLESLVNTTYSAERFNDKKVNQTALKIYKLIDRVTALGYVDHFHSITEAVKKHYVEEINLNSQKISVIPRGRNPVISAYSDKPKIALEPLQIINVGRHEFQKGQIYLLKALKVLKDGGYAVRLRIYGREGSESYEMRKYIAENNLDDIVSMEGFKNNIPDYLLQSHLFIFPSLYEGLGGALIEAQAAGLPIACNNIPVLHEVVKENKNAKFFDVHDTSSIVSSILFFLNNPENLENYGKESLLNYEAKFDQRINNGKLLELYQSLC